MTGKYQIQIGAQQFLQGMAASDYATNGGLGTSSSGIDPFYLAGTLKATTTATDISTNVTGTVVATAEDSQSISSYNRVFVDDDNRYYTYNGTSCTKRHDGAKTYTFGFSDMVSFSLTTYVTSTTDVASWNTSSLTLDETWWTVTKGKSALASGTPHPMLVFEGLLWIADVNNLHAVDSGGTVTTNVLVLNTNERIQALGIDPGTGLMMISVQVTQNYGDSLASRYFVMLYDGYSTKVRRKIEVSELVTAFFNVSGTVYVGYGLSVGYFNGSGITFLRKMQNVTRVGSQLLYKHHFASIGTNLFVADGSKLLAYGEPVGETEKKWFPIMSNPAGSFQIGAIGSFGGGEIGLASSDDHLYKFVPGSSGVGVGSACLTVIQMPRPIFVRRMRVITGGITTTSGAGGAAIINEKLTAVSPTIANFKVAAAASPVFVFDFEYGGEKMVTLQPRINFDTQGFLLYGVIIYYDVAE